MTPDQLRAKCELLAPAGCAASAATLRLFAERDGLVRLTAALTDRVAAQGELLARRAELPKGTTDGDRPVPTV